KNNVRPRRTGQGRIDAHNAAGGLVAPDRLRHRWGRQAKSEHTATIQFFFSQLRQLSLVVGAVLSQHCLQVAEEMARLAALLFDFIEVLDLENRSAFLCL